MPQWAMPTVPKFWTVGPSVCVARWGLPTSLRAQGKAPAMQSVLLSPAQMDEKLVQQLQEEEVAVEEAQLGRNIATSEVVMEAAGPLMQGQL